MNSAPWQEGYDAYLQKDKLEGCPYNLIEQPLQWHAWWDGYEAAEREHENNN
jgi:ribosome modulation factor